MIEQNSVLSVPPWSNFFASWMRMIDPDEVKPRMDANEREYNARVLHSRLIAFARILRDKLNPI